MLNLTDILKYGFRWLIEAAILAELAHLIIRVWFSGYIHNRNVMLCVFAACGVVSLANIVFTILKSSEEEYEEECDDECELCQKCKP